MRFVRRKENFYWWLITNVLPNRLLLLAFVYVYGLDGQAPTKEYKAKHDYWCTRNNLNW